MLIKQLHNQTVPRFTYIAAYGCLSFQNNHQVDILQSNTNADEWKLEVERVTPSLKGMLCPIVKLIDCIF